MSSTADPHQSGDLAWFKSSYSGSEGGDCIEVAYEWHKSSHSGSAGGNCLEVAYDWYKSSHSGSAGGDCVEVATCPSAIHVRDSKNPTGPVLTLSATAWATFLADVTN
ncbi:uncharacterized protein DUF397 [Streptomyces sp. 2333.5]|uniref:DUF397 domain-containing protein n=1 Tax=unclassified Streptomyces TaxID=2593676 RepID=UPI00089C90E7|nr:MULTISPECIES: DUF397 domain-containing protein [unclassified Streptomyces]PJJ04647.1 uncharacterized protein DUF397 [Streptomyces sp. 2333.5]SEE56930.1 protein of unknown function [Streptomyces sp. 2314.4]SEE83972.1 protein of unknown function [Streptomyces sp. 2112.2]